MPGPCPRTVNVHIDNNGNITVQPPTSFIDTDCQLIQFTFTPSLAHFAANPITFTTPPPAGFDPWVGDIGPGSGPNQLLANAKQPLPSGSTERKKYKYNVVPASGAPLDPDIQNDPYPPSAPGHSEFGHEQKDAHTSHDTIDKNP